MDKRQIINSIKIKILITKKQDFGHKKEKN